MIAYRSILSATQRQRSQQKMVQGICNIIDIYANNGNDRLTLLYEMRPIRERRTLNIKYSLTARLFEYVVLFSNRNIIVVV
jgi:hypothetical protein